MPFPRHGIPNSETFTRCQAQYSHLALMEVTLDIECGLTRLVE